MQGKERYVMCGAVALRVWCAYTLLAASVFPFRLPDELMRDVLSRFAIENNGFCFHRSSRFSVRNSIDKARLSYIVSVLTPYEWRTNG